MPEIIDIDKMVAGREMDARVEQEVMGQKVLGEAICSDWDDCPVIHDLIENYDKERGDIIRPVYLDKCRCEYYKDIPSEMRPIDIFGHVVSCLGVVPDYSNYIADAWPVVEKMYAIGWWGEITCEGSVLCEFHHIEKHLNGPEYHQISRAHKAPLAICKSSLKCVGVT